MMKTKHIHPYLHLIIIRIDSAKMQQSQIYYKADISFSNAFWSTKSEYSQRIGIRIFEAIILIAIIPIDITLLKWGDRMPAAQGLALASTIVCLILSLWSYCILYVKELKQSFYSIAQELNHITRQQIQDELTIQNLTSETMLYFPSQILVTGLDEKIINIYTKITIQQINYYYSIVYSFSSSLQKFDGFISFGVMITVIALMATSSQLNALEIVILTIFLVLQAYLKLKVMVILLLLALSPILCIIACIIVCCCKPAGSGSFQLDIERKAAKIDEVVKSSGQCAICLQQITVGESIYQLKCSDKHIFHDGCLDKWFKVKQNCPSCRQPLPLKHIGSSENIGRQAAQEY